MLDQGTYWVFVCNPRKWAIDKFLDRGSEHDTWGVRPTDASRFAPGPFAIVRVGVDRRNQAERDSRAKMVPGIYALCEVESEPFRAPAPMTSSGQKVRPAKEAGRRSVCAMSQELSVQPPHN